MMLVGISHEVNQRDHSLEDTLTNASHSERDVQNVSVVHQINDFTADGLNVNGNAGIVRRDFAGLNVPNSEVVPGNSAVKDEGSRRNEARRLDWRVTPTKESSGERINRRLGKNEFNIRSHIGHSWNLSRAVITYKFYTKCPVESTLRGLSDDF